MKRTKVDAMAATATDLHNLKPNAAVLCTETLLFCSAQVRLRARKRKQIVKIVISTDHTPYISYIIIINVKPKKPKVASTHNAMEKEKKKKAKRKKGNEQKWNGEREREK